MRSDNPFKWVELDLKNTSTTHLNDMFMLYQHLKAIKEAGGSFEDANFDYAAWAHYHGQRGYGGNIISLSFSFKDRSSCHPEYCEIRAASRVGFRALNRYNTRHGDNKVIGGTHHLESIYDFLASIFDVDIPVYNKLNIYTVDAERLEKTIGKQYRSGEISAFIAPVRIQRKLSAKFGRNDDLRLCFYSKDLGYQIGELKMKPPKSPAAADDLFESLRFRGLLVVDSEYLDNLIDVIIL